MSKVLWQLPRQVYTDRSHFTGEQVMADTFTLDVVQASELKHACVRNNVTNADLKVLSSGDVFAQILPILRGYGKVVVELLQLLGEIAFSGVSRFSARDSFTEPKFWLGDDFKLWFGEKVEESVKPSTLCYHKLLRSSLDAPIISALGGEEKAEVSLAEIFHLISLQPKGEEGDLLTSGYANIFYVRGVNNVLRVVRVYWYGGRWYVRAHETSYPHEWYDENRVFSRKTT